MAISTGVTIARLLRQAAVGAERFSRATPISINVKSLSAISQKIQSGGKLAGAPQVVREGGHARLKVAFRDGDVLTIDPLDASSKVGRQLLAQQREKVLGGPGAALARRSPRVGKPGNIAGNKKAQEELAGFELDAAEDTLKQTKFRTGGPVKEFFGGVFNPTGNRKVDRGLNLAEGGLFLAGLGAEKFRDNQPVSELFEDGEAAITGLQLKQERVARDQALNAARLMATNPQLAQQLIYGRRFPRGSVAIGGATRSDLFDEVTYEMAQGGFNADSLEERILREAGI